MSEIVKHVVYGRVESVPLRLILNGTSPFLPGTIECEPKSHLILPSYRQTLRATAGLLSIGLAAPRSASAPVVRGGHQKAGGVA